MRGTRPARASAAFAARVFALVVVVAGLGCGGGGAGGGGDGGADAALDGAAESRPDGALADGGAGDGTGAVVDAGACNAAAVAFPRGGSLAPGTLCDELYACADDAAEVARIQAASSLFQCAPGSQPESTCTAFTCAYRNPRGPSVLDADEVGEICRVTLVAPAPRIRCVVFVLGAASIRPGSASGRVRE